MAAAQLEEKLSCAICLLLYRDPVTLPCGHNFCGGCIRDWWGGREKECPECREPFPDGTELRRNVALSGVVEVVLRGPGFEPAPALAPDPDPAARCPRHGWPLELFCRTEGRCACSACTVQECRHHERALLHTERRERQASPRGLEREGPPPWGGGWGWCWDARIPRSKLVVVGKQIVWSRDFRAGDSPWMS